jgi:hypothetical protein
MSICRCRGWRGMHVRRKWKAVRASSCLDLDVGRTQGPPWKSSEWSDARARCSSLAAALPDLFALGALLSTGCVPCCDACLVLLEAAARNASSWPPAPPASAPEALGEGAAALRRPGFWHFPASSTCSSPISPGHSVAETCATPTTPTTRTSTAKSTNPPQRRATTTRRSANAWLGTATYQPRAASPAAAAHFNGPRRPSSVLPSQTSGAGVA